MKAAAALIMHTVAVVTAKNCGWERQGTANIECVEYYTAENCDVFKKAGEFVPTCDGNCFQYDSFSSLMSGGDGTYGVDCQVFSDSNCQNSIGDTWNEVIGNLCKHFPGEKSMKCFYRC
ncbi:hypothetical protein AAE478_001149 [Parahypoxylon ruwenzoriense]